MLTSDVEEQGTSLPTVVDPAARQALGSLMQKDPQFRWETFQARVGLIFSEFQIAWSSRDLKRMRPFLSDNLFQTQVYWIEAYKAQRLRNVTERTRITALELAKVASDKFFDAITVRLYATGLDYTVRDDDNRVVSGSRSKERSYSEYWTLVRGTGRNAPTRTDKVCPNCGAPLQINMAGHCEYCQAKVTSGEFDWVLSRIEQDESYEG
jgi:predicted lipid-binding transport protein (Tim44 family)